MNQQPPSDSPSPPSVEQGPQTRWRAKWITLLVIAGIICIADQASKHWAEQDLQQRLGHSVTVVDGYMTFTYVRNPGAAWGFLARMSPSFRRPFFISISLGAMAFILYLFVRLERGQYLLLVALASVMGGALGNFIDRVHLTYVVDFIDIHVRHYFKWPTFNVADIGITCGVILLFADMLLVPFVRRLRTKSTSGPALTSPAGEVKPPDEAK